MKNPLVYSTDVSQNLKSEKRDAKTSVPISSGPVKMRLESKGRGGKKVTVVFNLPFDEDESQRILRTLKSQLGTGGTFKDGRMEFSGDLREKIEQYFKKLEIALVRAGG